MSGVRSSEGQVQGSCLSSIHAFGAGSMRLLLAADRHYMVVTTSDEGVPCSTGYLTQIN